MFELFNKTVIKDVDELIEEIHNAFYSEVDRLLVSAKIIEPIETDKQALIDKSQRLKKLGFINSKEVIEGEEEINRLNKTLKENERKKNVIEAINYFSEKYPHYKFITEDSVKNICKKYNLTYSIINNYIGTVPDKNLQYIEEFKIDEDDECFSKFEISASGLGYDKHSYISNEDAKIRKGFLTACYIIRECFLEIVAPFSDFNIKKSKLNNNEIEIPDPIVLKPVYFKNEKHYLIVTAW